MIDPEGLFGIPGPGFVNVRPDKPYQPTSDDITELPWQKPKVGKAIPGQFGTAGLMPAAKLAVQLGPKAAETGLALFHAVGHGTPIPIYFEDLMRNTVFPRPETSACPVLK